MKNQSRSQTMMSGERLRIYYILDKDTFDFFAPVIEEYLFSINGEYITLSAYEYTIELEAVDPAFNLYLQGFDYQFRTRLNNLNIHYEVRGNFDVCI